MADELTPRPGEGSPVPGAAPVAAAPSIPEDYAELRKFREDYLPTLEAVSPYIEDIGAFVQDDEYRAAAQEFRKAYQSKKAEREKTQIPEQFQPVMDEFRKEFGPFLEDWKAEKTRKDQEAGIAAEAAKTANLEYAKRLTAEHPELAEHNYAGITMLAAVAQRDKVSLEDAYKTYGASMAVPPKREAPPRSLRGDAAAPGVPGPSTAAPIKSPKDIRERLLANLRAAGKTG